MDIRTQVEKANEMITQGAIVDGVKTFFAENAKTSDYDQLTTSSKSEMVSKMEQFTGAIAKVNGITHHNTLVDGNHSASEFTFDFDMKDGSKVLWHEIINRKWNDEGLIVKEEYFKA